MTDVTGKGYIYGIRDIRLVSIDGLTQVDLPAAQTMTWSETIVSADLRGDDVIVSSVAFIEGIEWNLESGGISLEAYELLTGETVVTAGTTPDRTLTLTRTGGKAYPWLKAYGRALGDGNDGLHVLLKKIKVNSLEGNLGNQAFYITKCGGRGVADDSNKIYDLIKLETDADLPTS